MDFTGIRLFLYSISLFYPHYYSFPIPLRIVFVTKFSCKFFKKEDSIKNILKLLVNFAHTSLKNFLPKKCTNLYLHKIILAGMN